MSQSSRLRVPAEDRAIFASPPLPQWPALLGTTPAGAGPDILGQSWTDLRRQARAAALAAARQYLSQNDEPLPSLHTEKLVLAGHQPELFHPGVWVKNFALHGLAACLGATPLNLVVDNDTAKACTLPVPAGRHLLRLPFDAWQGEMPYEERPVVEEELLATLPQRLAEITRPWTFKPFLPDFWSDLCRPGPKTKLLGGKFAWARRRWERAWNCHNLEVPVSLLCQTEPFAHFACHLLLNLGAFHRLYNCLLQDYRAAHRIRSCHHPVPDLAVEGDWLEAPFWAWRSGHKRRGRLFVRATDQALFLRCGAEPWPTLEGNTRSPHDLVAAWQDLERHGCKVRTRALTTTLYARLFLADLFVHGIGGGTYDVLTDALIRQFYQIEPSPYVVLSATLLLPLPRFPVSQQTYRDLRRHWRDVYCNPQRHLGELGALPEQARQWALDKQQWISSCSLPGQRRERFRHLQDLTRQLRSLLTARLEEILHDLEECRQQLETNAVAARRDFPFVLYPEPLLRSFCQQFLAPALYQ